MDFDIRLQLKQNTFTLDVDFSLPTTGVTALYGPSGSGKTSLLRAIAGLEKPQQAHLRFRDQVWQTDGFFKPPHQRPIGFVFQDSSLFDHLTVQQNIAFGQKRSDAIPDQAETDHIIDLLGISPLMQRLPDQLSGGECQRVAIARALLVKPDLLLMDEPMASLDVGRKKEILGYLERLKSELAIPLLYVSHNPDEVTRLADHLVILDHGRITTQGPIQQVLSDHNILGNMSEDPFTPLFGHVIAPCTAHHLTEVQVGNALFRMPRQKVKLGQDIRLHLYARDVSITLQHPEETSVLNIFDCTIQSIDPPTDEGQCLVHLRRQGTTIQSRISAYSCDQLGLHPGKNVFAQIKAVSIMQ